MGVVYVALAEGFEEIEAVNVIDLLRRAKIEVKSLSVTGKKEVTGSRHIKMIADELLENDINIEETDMIVLPGGATGTDNLAANKPLCNLLINMKKKGKRIAAICAAPSVLGKLGLVEGVECVCYPDAEYETALIGRKMPEKNITTITDGLITTSMGPATAMEFGLELIKVLKGEDTVNTVAKGLLYKI